MIPKSYTVGNFKAIGAPQTIELRPITLIFGKNSAGKSSVIQSLLLCRHALEKGNFDFTSTKRWGQTIDLGGFRQYIHRHDATNELVIEFQFRLSELEKSNSPVDSQVERQTRTNAEDDSFPPWSFSFLNFLSDISIRFRVGIPAKELGLKGGLFPRVKELQVSIDGAPTLHFSLDRNGNLALSKTDLNSIPATLGIGQLVMSYLELEKNDDSSLEELAESLGSVPTESSGFQDVVARVLDAYNEVTDKMNENGNLVELLASSETFARFVWTIGSRLTDEIRAPGRGLELTGNGLDLAIVPKNRLPASRFDVVASADGTTEDTGTALGNAVEVLAIEDPLDFFIQDPKITDDADALAKALRFDFEMLIDGVMDSLRYWLLGTEYIGPYRSIPGRFFQIAESEDSQAVDQGYQALREIARNPKLLRQISDIFQDTLDSPYRLEVRTIAPSLDFARLTEEVQRHLEVGGKKSGDPKDQVGKVIASFSEGKTVKGVYLVDTRTDTDVDFCDVGFGIGQVLPLVAEVASDRMGVVCIEQPEVHLHPKMQSDLADVFIKEKWEDSGVRQNLFILETHSEHIVLRLLRRIRETTRKKLPDGIEPLTPMEVSVSWVEAGKEGSVITPLSINDQGRFSDEWPSGFFEERLDEMF
tara:strand:+ start:7744 stop:9681 length:1938 start_codon:yes stop_codon:yes gene_type:complete